MIDVRENMIIANNEIITPRVENFVVNAKTGLCDISFADGQVGSYPLKNVEWLRCKETVNHSEFRVFLDGHELLNIIAIYQFSGKSGNYLHIDFEGKRSYDCLKNTVKIVSAKSCKSTTRSVFDYFKRVAYVVDLKNKSGTKPLLEEFDKLYRIPPKRAIWKYINPNENPLDEKKECSNIIYPFACDVDQMKAVKNTLENSVSIFGGAGGNGKTHTILNVVANLIIQNKSVQLLTGSDLASVTIADMIAENDLDFLMAVLGDSRSNQQFLDGQTSKYPDLSRWSFPECDDIGFIEGLNSKINALNKITKKREQISRAEAQRRKIEIELKYFTEYSSELLSDMESIENKRLSSKKVMQLWQRCQSYCDMEQKLSYWFKVRGYYYYGINNWEALNQDISSLIIFLQALFYKLRYEEISNDIEKLRKELRNLDEANIKNQITELSMKYFKNTMFKRYGRLDTRVKFFEYSLNEKSDKFQKEYPIVLSKTSKAMACFGEGTHFDYVIIDEAYQVDVVTGALALSTAENVLFVGDENQLLFSDSETDSAKLEMVFNMSAVDALYDYRNNNIVNSMMGLHSEIPKTIIRSHYRCHPNIIEFSNKKYYNQKLFISSTENEQSEAFTLMQTDCEIPCTQPSLTLIQSDSVQQDDTVDKLIKLSQFIIDDVLPKFVGKYSDIAIVSPLQSLTSKMRTLFNGHDVNVLSVNEFQGRAFDLVIMTAVNRSYENKNRYNVVISRAKKHLCVIVNDLNPPVDTNISELIGHINYYSFTQSDLISPVFEYVHTCYTKSRFNYLKKRRNRVRHDLETALHILLVQTLFDMEQTSLKVLTQAPLGMIVGSGTKLNELERHFAMSPFTQIDFLIYNTVTKMPLLAIHVLGDEYHKNGKVQNSHDKMKFNILRRYSFPILYVKSDGADLGELLSEKINEIFIGVSYSDDVYDDDY